MISMQAAGVRRKTERQQQHNKPHTLCVWAGRVPPFPRRLFSRFWYKNTNHSFILHLNSTNSIMYKLASTRNVVVFFPRFRSLSLRLHSPSPSFVSFIPSRFLRYTLSHFVEIVFVSKYFLVFVQMQWTALNVGFDNDSLLLYWNELFMLRFHYFFWIFW